MGLLLSSISKKLIMKHYILPCYCFIKFKFDLIHFMPRLHMNEEICMIENSIYKKIRTIFNIVNSSS